MRFPCVLRSSVLSIVTVLPHEKLYLDHLPGADRYSKSFMHRDVVNFAVMTRYVTRAVLAFLHIAAYQKIARAGRISS